MTTPRRTVHEVLLYEYAKIIADRRVGERDGLAPVERKGGRYWSAVKPHLPATEGR